ncbi:MAG TPA: hypothetical protein DDW51_27260 [Cyanobacteria bacterium UBA11367]|nr:hypothetical protein [Cyanobacteria bacterium UBA11367]
MGVSIFEKQKSSIMFEYLIELVVPLIPVDAGSEESQSWEIAKYNFDPGLQVGDEVLVTNVKIGNSQDEPFNFLTEVTKRQKEILVAKQVESSIFRVLITV